ncbi:MFS transporter [Bradyrhizobium sp. U87765 SZCCT0131]|uniref:MFS transporter n=1 Tax=unclassified Bradyrhizobium TaxID=2631580 RepID=UPI001BA5D646|nr:MULTISPECIES: MFS transporter [unclassified Bradyrhizobium]MBR1219508.1 MFS transporter [Bradyrhizobium sp. U87765 SZCCT0131]MBR1262159.1 MFS transporter [Bradyrhizobium sp. U87765 SZCCT0134]MBR1308658.1 MFS transporter [Bradyrhizobium sp. U87765 SZCCT0110]MBR1317941.1 MFS transporter [Bradyrhizobium sp. U87765 SZCCT0109]MBR1351644.1 MFS transporter [Bradyrhizobium sp. U87765 SZCCT0048]
MTPSAPSSPSRGGHAAVLAAVCLAAIVLPMSFSGGAVATPAIGRDLGGSPAALTWITNAFMLTFGGTLMAAGTLADAFGRKRAFVAGIAAFTVISLLLACASSIVMVDMLRAAQGLAAAATLAGGTAALAQDVEGHARTRAFSLLGTTFGLGLAFGPLLAGALIAAFGWRAVFAATAVVGLAALAFGARRMRDSRDPAARGLDWAGTLSFTAMLSLFTFGLIAAPSRGWGDPLVVSLFVGTLALLVVFIAAARRVARPMLDLSLFRYPRFVGVQMLPVATCACYIVLLVLLPLRLIGVEGFREIDAGWLMVALSAPMLVVPSLAATLTRVVPAGIVSAAGLVVAAAGLVWLGAVDPGGPVLPVIGPLLLIGCGAGLPWGLMDGLALSVVPTERAGMATGIFNTIRVAGEGIALAIAGAVLAALSGGRLHAALPDTIPAPTITAAAARLATGDLTHAAELLPSAVRPLLVASYAGAFQTLLWVLAAVTVAAALVVLLCLRQPQIGTDHRDAGALDASQA